MAEAIFDWERVETLLGKDLSLDPARTAKFPTFKTEDDIAQITRKIMNYVKKTQDTTELSDVDVARMVGMRPLDFNGDPSVEIAARNWSEVASNERLVWCLNDKERPIAVAVSSSAKKPLAWWLPDGLSIARSRTFGVENLAQRAVVHHYGQIFKDRYAGRFEPAKVDRLLELLANKKYSGKKFKHYWDEHKWSTDLRRMTAAALQLDDVKPHAPELVKGAKFSEAIEKIDLLTDYEIKEIWGQLPLVTREERGKEVEYYKIGFGGIARKAWIDAELDVNGSSYLSREMNRCWRSFMEDEAGIEYSADLERAYVRENSAEHSATVYQQKKNIPQTHLDAAETSVFKTSKDFKHVEIDSDVDLDALKKVEQEYQVVREFTGKTDAPTLRFRKTGRHKANGIYHPLFDNIAVDPRTPSSFIHEYAHHLDYTHGSKNLSSSKEFRPLLVQSQKAHNQLAGEVTNKQLAYYKTPTEVFARTSELYYYWKGLDTSLNGDNDKYSQPHFKVLEPLKDEIISYWDTTLEKLGGQLPNEQSIRHELETQKEIKKNVSIDGPAPIDPIGYGQQPSLFDMPDEQAETIQSIKTPARDDLKTHKTEQPSLTDWQETAAKYATREVDWDKINQYAPKDATRQTHNYQYDYDYQQETTRSDYSLSR